MDRDFADAMHAGEPLRSVRVMVRTVGRVATSRTGRGVARSIVGTRFGGRR